MESRCPRLLQLSGVLRYPSNKPHSYTRSLSIWVPKEWSVPHQSVLDVFGSLNLPASPLLPQGNPCTAEPHGTVETRRDCLVRLVPRVPYWANLTAISSQVAVISLSSTFPTVIPPPPESVSTTSTLPEGRPYLQRCSHPRGSDVSWLASHVSPFLDRILALPLQNQKAH